MTRAEIAEKVAEQCLALGDGQLYASCFPEAWQKIPRAGRWIIVKEVPHTALPWDVPLYSIWRARRVTRKRPFKISHNGRPIQWPLTLAEITTPGGDLTLYPTEYVGTTIEKWLELLDEGVTMHFIGEGDAGALEEAVFYLRAHGVRRREAVVTLLPQVVDSRFVYFTLDPT